ncbi:hypothetical protein [Aquimarina algiphila]|uniref:Uncharacterized protein n=1 Tax=Aquimarina algiphila TaxID=2047982 RepID=A0A554VI36_9FLAO|nr:hypothetical protein [Aquimarina algiphila]TSE07252.1 hypothetical protein FOF46_16340 [Aquimarina algiphila]
MQAQDLTKQQKEDLKFKVHMFTHNDEELQTLWYEDRMDEMMLQGKLREQYQLIVKYHVFKMKQLDEIANSHTGPEMQSKLKARVNLLNEDVKDILNKAQFEIHKNSWEAIVRGVTLRKGWATN